MMAVVVENEVKREKSGVFLVQWHFCGCGVAFVGTVGASRRISVFCTLSTKVCFKLCAIMSAAWSVSSRYRTYHGNAR